MVWCCKPGGRIVVTADMAPWIVGLFDELVEPVLTPPTSMPLTDPAVYYVVVDV
jgi:hypothetical protein